MGRARTERGGFTLIEIMVAILLAALMAGGVMAALGRGRSGHNLRASASVLCDALAYARSAAATEGRRYRWKWDAEARRWSVLRESNPAEAPGVFKPTTAAGKRSEGLLEGVALGGIYFTLKKSKGEEGEAPDLPPQITFHPDGHSESAFILLRAKPEKALEGAEESEGEALTVQVNGVTGRIRVLAGNAVEEMAAKTSEEGR